MNPVTCRMARVGLGMTLSQLAKEAGVSANTVAQYERGIHMPKPLIVNAISNTLSENGVSFLVDNGAGAGVRVQNG